MLKLNLGCGKFPKEGFINLDIRGDLKRIFLDRYNKGTDIFYTIEQWDFRNGLKDYPDESVDAITESHALMYLKVEEYKILFEELYRVLKNKGIFRITEDNCERSKEELKLDGLPWGNPASVTGPLMMRNELNKVFSMVHDVSSDQTYFIDNSLIQQFHGTPPRVFHMEAMR